MISKSISWPLGRRTRSRSRRTVLPRKTSPLPSRSPWRPGPLLPVDTLLLLRRRQHLRLLVARRDGEGRVGDRLGLQQGDLQGAVGHRLLAALLGRRRGGDRLQREAAHPLLFRLGGNQLVEVLVAGLRRVVAQPDGEGSEE